MAITEIEIMKNWIAPLSKPKVSISCITYNHEEYIAKALDSFLMQKTNFPFEIIIHDDASTDKTAEIIRKYEKEYPHIIKPIYQRVNQFSLGKKPSHDFTFKKAQGKYIALCEGDDYWIDENKLQLQVSFLEDNPSYSMSFHRSDVLDEEHHTKLEPYPFIDEDKSFTIYDFLKGNLASTASIVRRKEETLKYPENFDRFKLGDWPFNMIYASVGKVKYHANIMSCYRLHNGGVWSKKNEIKKYRYTIYMLEEMDIYFNKKYHNDFSKIILRHLYQLMEFYLERQQVLKAFVIFRHITKKYSIQPRRRFKLLIKLYKMLLKKLIK